MLSAWSPRTCFATVSTVPALMLRSMQWSFSFHAYAARSNPLASPYGQYGALGTFFSPWQTHDDRGSPREQLAHTPLRAAGRSAGAGCAAVERRALLGCARQGQRSP